MAEEKKSSYSLINVERAPEEEVIVVDTSGVHTVHEPVASDSDAKERDYIAKDEIEAADRENLSVGEESEVAAEESEVVDRESNGVKASESALDDLTEEDLNGKVPMQKMHLAIIILVLLGLVLFGVYFFFLR